MMFSFEIPGAPVPCARPRVTKNGAYETKRSRDYKKKARAHAAAACPEGWPKGERYAIQIRFCNADKRKRDLDNLAKGVIDACKGILWDDDSQIDEMSLLRVTGEAEHAGVTVVVLS